VIVRARIRQTSDHSDEKNKIAVPTALAVRNSGDRAGGTTGGAQLMIKNVLVVLVLSIVLSSCGPSDFEKEKLAFEEKKYNDEQAAKAEAARKEEQDKQEQGIKWATCRQGAQLEFDDEFKLWGEPVPGKPGIRSGPANQKKDMEDRLQRQYEGCDRKFPKGVSY
jgi:hypothetical protein